MIELGSYILDTLQIFFPWDDDLYTYFKNKGLGTRNTKKRALPLIYTDNTCSTSGVDSLGRNYVLVPEYFNKTYRELGWIQDTSRRGKVIIPAECPQAKVILINEDTPPRIRFKIIPIVENKEQYHLEYSVRAAFGKMYSNWSVFYFTINDFEDMIRHVNSHLQHSELAQYRVEVETKQDQREELHYVEVPIISYNFCLGEFKYAVDYLRFNGVDGIIPSLVYDSRNLSHKELMTPVLKFGIVHTTNQHGFMSRSPQLALKISQSKAIEVNNRRKKVKGIIDERAPCENWVDVPPTALLEAFESIKSWYNNQPFSDRYPLH